MLGAHLHRLSVGIAGYCNQHELGSSSLLQYYGSSLDALVLAREANVARAKPKDCGLGLTGALNSVCGDTESFI